ncbi:MAG: tyrosine-type recombinase/integrase [Clostridium sp.]|nr:tyrosine-type recombinase/integrase [Clostridium sp.]
MLKIEVNYSKGSDFIKHPNGYGTVAKLSGNRRKPFVARKTKGWDERGYPVYETIGYYPTREAGLIALAQFNNQPWDVDKEKTTLEELFKLWLEKKAPKLGTSNRQSLKSAFKHCSKLFKMKYTAVKSYHMQEVIDNCGFGYSTQSAIKNLFGHLDRFALELDIVTRCYSDLLTSEPIPETSKKPFTDDEIERLWAIQNEPWVDSVLVFLYTGFRISELLDLKCADVDLEQGTIKGGTKTRAGKDRLVPVHSRIAEFVHRRVLEGGQYLFPLNGHKCATSQYYAIWGGIMERINAQHTVHECRHTFRSRLDSAGANKRCIDLIMGHKSKDVGERVYTHKTIQELKDAIELITR